MAFLYFEYYQLERSIRPMIPRDGYCSFVPLLRMKLIRTYIHITGITKSKSNDA